MICPFGQRKRAQAATQTAIRNMQNNQRRRRERELEEERKTSNSVVKRSSNFEKIVEDATKNDDAPN